MTALLATLALLALWASYEAGRWLFWHGFDRGWTAHEDAADSGRLSKTHVRVVKR